MSFLTLPFRGFRRRAFDKDVERTEHEHEKADLERIVAELMEDMETGNLGKNHSASAPRKSSGGLRSPHLPGR